MVHFAFSHVPVSIWPMGEAIVSSSGPLTLTLCNGVWMTEVPPNAERYICIINFNGNGDLENGEIKSHGSEWSM